MTPMHCLWSAAVLAAFALAPTTALATSPAPEREAAAGELTYALDGPHDAAALDAAIADRVVRDTRCTSRELKAPEVIETLGSPHAGFEAARLIAYEIAGYACGEPRARVALAVRSNGRWWVTPPAHDIVTAEHQPSTTRMLRSQSLHAGSEGVLTVSLLLIDRLRFIDRGPNGGKVEQFEHAPSLVRFGCIARGETPRCQVRFAAPGELGLQRFDVGEADFTR